MNNGKLYSMGKDKWKIYGKWFWVGIAIGLLNGIAGIVFGLALATEEEHREAVLIIVVWSIVSVMGAFMLTQWLLNTGNVKF